MSIEGKRIITDCSHLTEMKLKQINIGKWTVCSHGDGDGICSAAIALSSKRMSNANLIITHPMGIAHDIRDVESNLFISDIALDQRTYEELYAKFERLIAKGYEVVYIDHHRIHGTPPEGVQMINDESCCASELVHRYFTERNEVPDSVDIIACIGCICDYYDDTDYIKKVMNRFEKRALFLDAGIMAQGLSIYRKKTMKDELVRELVDGNTPCEIPQLVEQAMQVTHNDKVARDLIIHNCSSCKYIAWCLNPPCGKSKAAHFVSATQEKDVGLSIFHYIRRKEKERPLYDLCFRGTNKFDLREIVSPLALHLGGSGGGHFNAVGSRVPIDLMGLMLYYLDLRITHFYHTGSYADLPLPKNIEEEKELYDTDMYDRMIDLKHDYKSSLF